MLTDPKRVLAEVANKDAEGRGECDGPNNDDCEAERATEGVSTSNELSSIAE